ncbi:hypothetical protein SAMN05443633_110102 [Chryseobacterium arachidis]|uniref:Uncharacterized protein n=1 Tax=Chryseobacterium arachidis TaxID=1416778 RepID=A0A1M5H748_9FLAO|nr:hypothetical protein [Chryseobacterium arachidis]SHG11820.1 hypothetical protein SAMN05443633_110102 [Chryseobacterium arachidis]
MDFHNHFTTTYFLALLSVLIIANFAVIRQRKLNWKLLLDWKIILLTLIVTFAGLLYYETSNSKDWIIKTYGFPKYFYLKKYSANTDHFLSFGILRIDYINFIQNFVLFFLVVGFIFLWMKRTRS